MDYKLYPGKERKIINFEEKNIENPIVTIITPYYNGDKYIEETANSILNQTFPAWEWIIVDDGSKNKKSIEKLNEIENIDKRIKIYHKKNEGPAAARDFGIKKASTTSKYVVFLDADDLIIKTFLECAYWTLETHPKADWTYCDTVNFDGEEFLWRKWYQVHKMKKENILVMTAMVKKEAILAVNGFEIYEKNIYEDWCLWLKLIEQQRFPVRMNLLGFWYRKKPKEESELQQSNANNKENAMRYVNKIAKRIEQKEKRELLELKDAIQFPKEDYNWEIIKDNQENIKTFKKSKNGKIQILMIIPWMKIGGADKFNLDIIQKCNKDKFEFTILTTEPSTNEWGQYFEENATIYDITTFLDRKDWVSFVNYIINKNDIDLILNTNTTFGYAILPYLKVNHPEIPIIDYVHMEEWYNRNGGFSRDSSTVASVIDKTYVCNKNSEKILVDYFGRNPKDVNTVYIGVDEKKYNPTKFDKQRILEKRKIETNGKYVISYICRISEQKRPFLLLQIIKKLLTERKDILFIIAGEGPLLEGMKNEAERLKIKDNIIFLGNISKTEEIYAISDITINCSIKEGLALTAYESLSMGVPVISCDVGGQKELVDEEVGIIVPCLQEEKDIFKYDYKEKEIVPYVNGINKILKDLNEYKSNARKRIIKGFTIDNMIKNMETIFEETVKNPNQEKILQAKQMHNNKDITKELITKYFIGQKMEYNWLANELNKVQVDYDYKYAKQEKKRLYYENTLEYKIKHPFYVILTKLHLYDKIKKIIKK